MFCRRSKLPSPAMAPTFSYCETVMATDLSPWHIRRVGEEGLKLGGGAPNTVLCGRDLMRGWDLKLAVTPETVARLERQPGEVSPVHPLCGSCVTVYRTID